MTTEYPVNYKTYMIEKINGLQAQLKTLSRLDFPYKSSEYALEKYKEYFIKKKSLLKKQTISKSLKHECSLIWKQINKALPIMGIIANSANVRNIFEVHDPLLILAVELFDHANTRLTTDLKLIVSYEWRFSPFIQYSDILEDFIIIGMPASEASNPLLLSLAGHELGHHAWRNALQKIKDKIDGKLKDELRKCIKTEHLVGTPDSLPLSTEERFATLYNTAIAQLKELFCDFYGLRLFQESFLHALYYFASPINDDESIGNYPAMTSRLQYLLRVAPQLCDKVIEKLPYEIDVPPHKCNNDNCRYLCNARETLLSDIADLVCELLPNSKREIFAHDNDEEQRIIHYFKKLVPAPGVKKLADIINAGWVAYFDIHSKNSEYDKRVNHNALMDLLAKNLEVFAIENRLKNHSL